MTGQPPEPPDDPTEGWDEPDTAPRRLYPVPDEAPSDPPAPAADSRQDGQAPWGNSPDELLEAVMGQLDELTHRLGELDQLITADRHDQAGTGAGKHLRFRYERHPQADAAAAHAELSKWVSWLVATYQLADAVPPCWDRHDALAEELAGFFVAWQNVWADEGRYDAAVLWHDQLHRAATGRWAGWLRGARCTESCALDVVFAEQTHRRWTGQSAAADGGRYRLDRTRRLPPPIPVPPKQAPAAGGKAPRSGKAKPRSTTTPPPTGRTRP